MARRQGSRVCGFFGAIPAGLYVASEQAAGGGLTTLQTAGFCPNRRGTQQRRCIRQIQFFLRCSRWVSTVLGLSRIFYQPIKAVTPRWGYRRPELSAGNDGRGHRVRPRSAHGGGLLDTVNALFGRPEKLRAPAGDPLQAELRQGEEFEMHPKHLSLRIP